MDLSGKRCCRGVNHNCLYLFVFFSQNAILVQLYQATSEDVEIRIAAYYIAMKCPHEELFKQVQKTLLKETSSQGQPSIY